MTALRIIDDHTQLLNVGSNTHAQIDTHIADGTLHFTVGSIDHGSIAGLGDDDHTQYALLLGRAGGQTLIGGTAAGNVLTLQGSSAGGDAGFININSPVQYDYDTFSDAQQFAIIHNPTATITGSYIGGFLSVAATHNVTTGVYIPATFSDTTRVNVGATPGFSAFTFINELATVANDGNFNLPSALVMNIGLTHERNTSGTSTTPGTTGISFSPQTRATASGAIMTKTDQTAVRCSPTWSTVGGSTVNLGTIRGVHVFNPALALFQPQSGVENVTAVIGLDVNSISSFGNCTRAAVRSAITANGSNAYFLKNDGNAHSDMGAGHLYFDDNAGITYGGNNGTADWDAWMRWSTVANALATMFINTLDEFYISTPSADRFLFDSNGGNTVSEFNFNFHKASFGAQTGANGNSFLQFPCPARATAVNGGWVDVSFSQAGNLTINHTMSDVSMFNAAAISLTGGTGSITGYITTFNVGMTTSGVTGVETSALRPNGRIHHRGVMELPPLEPAQITANVNNYSPATFNSMRQVWSVTSDAARSITGILIPTSANTADTQWIVNTGGFAITLTHQDVLSTASNRFISPTGANYVIGPDESACLWHDPTADRWRILWGTGA